MHYKIKGIPLICHETTTIIIDDDVRLLKEIENALSSLFKIKTFSHANTFFEFLEKNKNENPYLLEKIQERESGKFKYSCDINTLHHVALNANRRETISTIISDYNMIQMQGDKLLSKVHDNDIQKIILTGWMGFKPIPAFNEGIMHAFLEKDNDLWENIIQAMKVSQYNYFFSKYSYVSSQLGTNKFSANQDPELISTFSSIVSDNKITEFYILDQNGTFLCVNKDGMLKLLFIQCYEEYKTYTQEALTEWELSKEYETLFSNESHMVCWSDHNGIQFPNKTELPLYVKPVTKISETKKYYFALTDFPQEMRFDRQSIINGLYK